MRPIEQILTNNRPSIQLGLRISLYSPGSQRLLFALLSEIPKVIDLTRVSRMVDPGDSLFLLSVCL